MKKILMFLFICLLMPLSVFAKTVTVTGMGGSEKTALKDAMRLAVESALGAYIESSTVTENYAVIKDRINSHSEGYITKYEIVEKTKENGIYRVTIKADVRDDVTNIILSDKEKRAKVRFGLSDPRIAISLANVSNVYLETVENAFIDGFKDIGFSRIIKDKANADFVVTVNINENKTGAVGANFVINAKILSNKTKEVLFAGSESAMGAGTAGRNHAIKRAVKKLLDKIDLKTLELATNPENHVTVIITNPKQSVTSMQNFLNELQGVNGVYLRRANGIAAEFDLNYIGNATDLAELLESKGIKIKSVERDIVKI